MIKYNNSNINDWYFADDNIIKVYRNNAVCYYKITSSGGTSGQTPCYAVVDDISQYSETEFEDVFNKADGKWYKLNNLSQYEEYGVYGSGRTITTYEGKLTIDEEITPSPSRLPSGYTEVEYIRQNSNYNAYINTGVIIFDNTTNTYTITTRLTSEFHSDLSCATIINCEYPVSPYNGLGYRYKCSSTVDELEFFGGNANYSSSVVDNGDGTRTVSFQSTGATTFTNNAPLSLCCAFSSTSFTTPNRFADASIYSSTIVKNGVTVRDFVPAKRDSDSVYGLYDLINDTFYTSPNGNNFSGGSEVTPPPTTATCEFIYTGGSWVNVGEVSGSTIDTVWIDPPSTSNQYAAFSIDHYWGEGYKMVFNTYLSGSYSSDVGSFWQWQQHTPIEFNFYANGFYYDFHNPTSTSAPDVATNDYSWRIMKNGSLGSYENRQIFNVTLTNGTVRVELEDGTAIVTGSTSVSTQSWYNGLYSAAIGIANNSNKCHLSHIQVYNTNDVLVNDIKFVRNAGVTGKNEISAYDSVLNITYNNTNSYTPSYHVVTDSGGTEYPLYYDEIQDPPNNVSFSSMTEAEEYECPWVGMIATIDGVKYVFSGDSQSGYEWVEKPSRLPSGYTEVEYIENTGTTYIITNFKPNQDTRIVTEMQTVSSTSGGRFIGAGGYDGANAIQFDYEYGAQGTLHISWGGRTGWSIYSACVGDYNRHTYDWDKNYFYRDKGTSSEFSATTSYTSFQCTDYLAIFTRYQNGSGGGTNECLKGKMYSFQMYDNGTLIRDLVPCTRVYDNKVGAYDIVNNVFYIPSNGNLIAGNPV